ADSTSVSSTALRTKVERLITLSTSAVAVCCSSACARCFRACASSRVRWSSSLWRFREGPRLRLAFGAFRRRVLTGWPPALERRLIAFPKAQDKALYQTRTPEVSDECPLWVKSRHRRMFAACPLYLSSGHGLSASRCSLWVTSGHPSAHRD